MNRNTSPAPSSDALMPSRIESAPSDGPIERSSSSTSGIGSAPERSWIAVLFASSRVKSPVISPRRPILLWITGAVITLPSMIAASRWPMFAPVKSRNTFAPSAFHWNVISGRLRRSNSMRASSSMSPFRTAFLRHEQRLALLALAVGVEHDLLVVGHGLAELGLEQLLAGRRVEHRLELQEGRLLDQAARLGGVLHAGHLHEDAAVALRRDHRLAHALLVDALAQHLERGRGAAVDRVASRSAPAASARARRRSRRPWRSARCRRRPCAARRGRVPSRPACRP